MHTTFRPKWFYNTSAASVQLFCSKLTMHFMSEYINQSINLFFILIWISTLKSGTVFNLSGLSCPVTVWFSISINREVDIATIQLNWTENQCIDASFFSLHIAYTLYRTYNQLLLYFIEKNNNAIIIVIVLALCFYCFNLYVVLD